MLECVTAVSCKNCSRPRTRAHTGTVLMTHSQAGMSGLSGTVELRAEGRWQVEQIEECSPVLFLSE